MAVAAGLLQTGTPSSFTIFIMLDKLDARRDVGLLKGPFSTEEKNWKHDLNNCGRGKQDPG